MSLCSCCKSNKGCHCNTCGGFGFYAPKSDIQMTLIGSGSSPQNTCTIQTVNPGVGWGCSSLIDESHTVDITLKYNHTPQGDTWTYDWGAFDPDIAPYYSGIFRFLCFGLGGQIGLGNNPYTLESIQAFPLSQQPDPNKLTFFLSTVTQQGQIYGGLNLPGFCNPPSVPCDICPPTNCNGGTPSRVYYYATLNNLLKTPSSGYCVDICTYFCDNSSYGNPDANPPYTGPVQSPAYATVTITDSNNNIIAQKFSLGCTNIDIGTSGYYNINIKSLYGYGTINETRYLYCGEYDYLFQPCYNLNLENGQTWYYTYNRPYQKALLDHYNNVFPYQEYIQSCNGTSSCSVQYCIPKNAIIGQGISCNGCDICTWTGPYNTYYYTVFVNNSVINFTVGTTNPDRGSYWSDIQLLYAYVIYFPQGETVCIGTPSCSCTDGAVVIFQYAAIKTPLQTIPSCNFPSPAVYVAQVPGLNPPSNMDCGCNNCVFDGVGFCGINAFSQAEEFAKSLPQTIRYGDFGSYGDDSVLIEAFPFDYNTTTIGCPPLTWYNTHAAADCNGYTIFGGQNNLTWRTS